MSADTRHGPSSARPWRRLVVLLVTLAVLAGVLVLAGVGSSIRLRQVSLQQGERPRVVLEHTMAVQPVAEQQVQVVPASRHRVETRDRQVIVTFDEPFEPGAEYQLTVTGVQGFRGGPAAPLTHRWRAADPRWCAIVRSPRDDPGRPLDQVQCGTASSLALGPAATVLTAAGLDEVAVLPGHVVVSSTTKGRSELRVVDLATRRSTSLAVPAAGRITGLRVRTQDQRWLLGFELTGEDGTAHLWFASGAGEDFSQVQFQQATDDLGTPMAISSWRPADVQTLVVLDRAGRMLALEATTKPRPALIGQIGMLQALAPDNSAALVTGADGAPSLRTLPGRQSRALEVDTSNAPGIVDLHGFLGNRVVIGANPDDPGKGGRILLQDRDGRGPTTTLWNGASGIRVGSAAPSPDHRLLGLQIAVHDDPYVPVGGEIVLHPRHAHTLVLDAVTGRQRADLAAVGLVWQS